MELQFLLEQAQNLKAELDTFRPLDAEREARVLQKLRLDWNYHSNHLEGGKLTYGETKALILFGLTAQGKPLQDHLETSGHDEAIKWIEEIVHKDYPLTEKFIRELHELILKEPYYKKAITPDNKEVLRRISIGVYKSQPNHVKTKTGEIFYFASPEETPAMMNDLMDWYHEKKEDKDLHPILFASEFHYKFICIHPFDDGNGRLARLLMNFILMQFGYPPAIIKTEDKENYFAVLQQADAGILEPFMAYIAENVIRSLEIMLKGAKGENIEDPDDLEKKLALLEHKLKSRGDKIEKTKSNQVLEDWFKKDFILLVEKFIEMNEKFKNLYVKRDYQISYFGSAADVEIYFNKETFQQELLKVAEKVIRFLLSEDENEGIELICNHSVFSTDEVDVDDEQVSVNIRFDTAKYIITGNASDRTLSRLYGKEFTLEEINYVLEGEADALLAEIQSQIEEL